MKRILAVALVAAFFMPAPAMANGRYEDQPSYVGFQFYCAGLLLTGQLERRARECGSMDYNPGSIASNGSYSKPKPPVVEPELPKPCPPKHEKPKHPKKEKPKKDKGKPEKKPHKKHKPR